MIVNMICLRTLSAAITVHKRRDVDRRLLIIRWTRLYLSLIRMLPSDDQALLICADLKSLRASNRRPLRNLARSSLVNTQCGPSIFQTDNLFIYFAELDRWTCFTFFFSGISSFSFWITYSEALIYLFYCNVSPYVSN